MKGTPFIAVAMNYRVNIFGFGASSTMLASQDSDAPVKGVNFGLHDQKLALIWIKHHIGGFGGDPTRLTIMGQSAGATSCHLHLLEAESGTKRPLFRKAALMSGAFGGLDVSTIDRADERWEKLCWRFSVHELSPMDRLESLKTVATDELLRAVTELCWRFFTLVIDGSSIRQSGPDNNISVHLGHDNWETRPKQIDDDVEVLLGATSHEFYGFARMANWTFEGFNTIFRPCFPSEEVAESILQAYGIVRTASDEVVQSGFVQFISDSTMTYAKTHCAAELLKARRGMRQKSPRPYPKCSRIQLYHVEFGNPFLGPMHGIAHHGVDLIYSFGNFESALENCDRGVPEGYEEPGQNTSEHLDPNHSPTAMAIPLMNLGCQQDYKSHLDLSRGMQDELVDFIVRDPCHSESCEHSDQIRLYCADRSVRLESSNGSEKWKVRKEKYDVLGKDIGSMVVASKKLVGSVLNMTLD